MTVRGTGFCIDPKTGEPMPVDPQKLPINEQQAFVRGIRHALHTLSKDPETVLGSEAMAVLREDIARALSPGPAA